MGDWVIYRKQKRSSSPGPRAKSLHAAQSGEDYAYIVEKYWIVHEIGSDGILTLITRQGKQHIISRNDPRLRKPRLIERWFVANRFREVEKTRQTASEET
ncbi:hypothetical protein OAK91_00270 [Planctomycetaceae bacterium]|nr:hypothetical protein [Planctomycetaceae bacterium]MDC0273149.1 hypothetical protein [Planctomycetaceae bacterium]